MPRHPQAWYLAKRKNERHRQRKKLRYKLRSLAARHNHDIPLHDIAMQILCWMFNGEHGTQRFRDKSTLWVGLSAGDLADAYHGVPNIPSHMNLCIVALRNPHSGVTEFYVSRCANFSCFTYVLSVFSWHVFYVSSCTYLFPRSF